MDYADTPRGKPLLEIHNLTVEFGRGDSTVRAVNDVSLSIGVGEALGVVGESGSGKSTLAMAAMNLLGDNARANARQIAFNGREMMGAGDRAWRDMRGGDVSLVPQNPLAALNPVHRIGAQLREAIRPVSGRKLSRGKADRMLIDLLTSVGLPNARDQMRRYPHELSGGMRQRVLVAMALVNRPRLLIADEATTALDVTVQAQILALLQSLIKGTNLSLMFISHNIAVVSKLCDTIAVMHGGDIVELGPSRQIVTEPRHPYTKLLISAAREMNSETGRFDVEAS